MNCRHARRPPIAQRPSSPAFSRHADENPAAAKIKEPLERGTRQGTWQELPFNPLEPEARASRARWSSSTRDTLLFHRFALSMAPSIARLLPAAAGEGAAPISRRAPTMCELDHTPRDLFGIGYYLRDNPVIAWSGRHGDR